VTEPISERLGVTRVVAVMGCDLLLEVAGCCKLWLYAWGVMRIVMRIIMCAKARCHMSAA